MRILRGVEPALRRDFADACEQVGPDAPTLCEGWTVRDLVVHLVLIEHRWDSWAAVPLGRRSIRLRDYYDGLVEAERSRIWSELLTRIRTGPHRNPLRSQRLRDRMVPREYLIHTEDVRRANGLGATISADAQETAWQRLPGLAKRMLLTEPPFGVEIRHPDGRVLSLTRGEPVATLEGEPLECLLYVFGRGAVARAELTGDAGAVIAAHVRDTTRAAQSLPRAFA